MQLGLISMIFFRTNLCNISITIPLCMILTYIFYNCTYKYFLGKRDKIMTTTIRIKRNTKRRLEDMGKKNETFDDILNKLLDFYDSNK